MLYRVEVSGAWCDHSSQEWVPAVTGTLNGTGMTDEEASTFDTREQAQSVLEYLEAEARFGDCDSSLFKLRIETICPLCLDHYYECDCPECPI